MSQVGGRILKGALAAGVLAATALYARSLTHKDYFRNSSDQVFSPLHMAFEAATLALAAFLIVDGCLAVRASRGAPWFAGWRYHVRLGLGVGIIAVHVTVLLAGGYHP